ncbi:MAG: ATP-binding protein [Roseburia sp.]|nr:ATP-binding protein [Roseburia sp.]
MFQLFLVITLGIAFQVTRAYVISVVFLEIFVVIFIMGIDFRKKSVFYNDMLDKLEGLDKKYLIMEMIQKPGFLEGDIFCDAVYESGKAMNEQVVGMENSVCEFKEYIETWIHEIKLPISALSLMDYNERKEGQAYREQVRRISNYVEQILYYTRADAPQNDFLMKKCRVEQLVNSVLQANRDLLIGEKFTIEKENTDVCIRSDAKWVQFMLGQIVSNSVKYKGDKPGYLKFSASEDKDCVMFSVEDHGIGVKAGELERVFEKTFTGENGRKTASSTGMGLYICRKMCRKLGHEIWMESEEGRFTRVVLRFGKDNYVIE